MSLMKLNPSLLFVFLFTPILISCGDSSQEKDSDLDSEPSDQQSIPELAYCLWDGISLRQEPNANAKYLTAVSMGEKLKYLDSVAIDKNSEKKYEYCQVELSDGSKGWVRSEFIVRNASLGAITNETQIYSRPDLLTDTKKSFKKMDLVAIYENQNGFSKVKGIIHGGSWYTEGWIKNENINKKEANIIVSKLFYKAISSKTNKERYEQIDNILNNVSSIEESIFYHDLQKQTLMNPDNMLKKDDYPIMMCMANSATESYLFNDESSSIVLEGNEIFGIPPISDLPEYEFYTPFILTWMFRECLIDILNMEKNEYGYADFDTQLEAVRKKTGLSMYTRLEHHESQSYSFNYVNPEFVYWVRDNAIPNPEDNFLGVSCQSIYDKLFKKSSREIYAQLSILLSELDLANYRDEYRINMHDPNFEGLEYLGRLFGQRQNINPELAGIFIRRAIDGSLPALASAMKKGMFIYDKEWHDEYPIEIEHSAFYEGYNFDLSAQVIIEEHFSY